MIGHIAKEVAKNVVKGAFPNLVTRLRGHTGRGKGVQPPEAIAAYGRDVLANALKDIGVKDCAAWVKGRTLAELGPGDTLASGLYGLALGAGSYVAVDRYAFRLDSDLNRKVYAALAALLEGEPKARLAALLSATGGIGLGDKRLQVLREPAESFALAEPIDLLFTQSVLEHVVDLPDVFAAMTDALKPGAWMVHGVDLGDHGLYPGQPLRFLSYSPRLWSAMHRFRGSPNREPLSSYRELAAVHGLQDVKFEVTATLPLDTVRAARPSLHSAFRDVSDEDLRVLSFRMLARKPR